MKFILKLGASAVSALLVWEIVLQLFVSKMPMPQSHPILGRISSGGVHVHGTEGFSWYTTNSIGMRESEIAPKGSNEYRILVLGDSYTEAAQLFKNKTYTALLERMLNSNGNDKSIRVLNFGMSGHSPAYYLQFADYYNELVSPDYVVIQVNDGDFSSDLMNTNNDKALYIASGDTDYKIMMNASKFNASSKIIQKYPRLGFITSISTIRMAKEKLAMLLSPANTVNASYSSIQAKADYKTEEIMDWTLRQFKQKYTNVSFLYLPSIDYGNPETESHIAELLNRYAAKYDFPVFNMTSDFTSYYKQTRQPVHGFHNTSPGEGHMNEAGHELVARRLDDFFERRAIH